MISSLPNSNATGENAHRERRKSDRTSVRFPVSYCLSETHDGGQGLAIDLSTGGMRLQCSDWFLVGDQLQIAFQLPDDVLAVYPPGDARREELFDVLQLTVQIISTNEEEHYSYGLAFCDADTKAQDDLWRYVHLLGIQRARQRRQPSRFSDTSAA